MPEITLSAEAGRATGSGASGRLRTAGKIPGVIYGHGIDPIAVAVDGRALRAAFHTDAGLNALLNLEVNGESHLTMARDIQRDSVRNVVIHVDFQVVRRDEIISADVPVVLVGEPTEVLRGDGVVAQEIHTLSVNATPLSLPNEIEVDISGLEIGASLRVSDLRLPDGVTTDVDPEAPIAVAHAPQAVTEDEAEAEAAAEAEAGEAPEGAEAGGDDPGQAPEGGGGEG